MNLASVKKMVAKGMILAVSAGALIAASSIPAAAQGFSLGVRIGQPYYAPRNYDYGRYDREARYERYQYARQVEIERQEEFERRQARLRHEEWEHEHRYDRSYGYR